MILVFASFLGKAHHLMLCFNVRTNLKSSSEYFVWFDIAHNLLLSSWPASVDPAGFSTLFALF